LKDQSEILQEFRRIANYLEKHKEVVVHIEEWEQYLGEWRIEIHVRYIKQLSEANSHG